MKAIAVIPGKPGSVHLTELPKPSIDEIPNGRGVLVRVLRVGVDGTDKEINAAEYGAAPSGYDFLVIGHESFGVVEEVGKNVTELVPGDYVTATVRRPGGSIYDKIGMYDTTTDDNYFEHGINLLHGFLTEYYVEDPEYLVKVPKGLKEYGVLLEPTSVIEKGIAQAYEIQRRLRVWHPKRAAVLGAGTIGLLAAMALRLRGMQVHVFGRTRAPYLNSDLIEQIGAHYHTTDEINIMQGAEKHGPFDIIFEATGFSPIVFEAMNCLGKNGVLVLSSVTGGDRKVEVPCDMINLGFVLGNKVVVGTVNANREYFEMGVKDLSHAEHEWPGWISNFLTHPVKGLENYKELMNTLTNAKGAIKVFCEVAPIN
ncbi:MAG TPA: glucose 1-dehydrogenase [Thermodesulfobacteriota bacterium]|nr:glucose 1-dehydrogenase [Thermodesulfobacteriota bacterium]